MRLFKVIFSLMLVVIFSLQSNSILFANENVGDYRSSKEYLEAYQYVNELKQQNDILKSETLNYFNFADSEIFSKVKDDINKRQAFYVIYEDELKKPVLQDEKNLSKAPSGTYPSRAGVILITTGKDSSSGIVGHAGIVSNSSYTVESFPQSNSPLGLEGVQVYPNNWYSRYEGKQVYANTLYDTTSSQDSSVAQWCKNQVGKPYNFPIGGGISTRAKFYCSHLVWAGYKDLTGYDISFGDSSIGVVAPMDLYYDSKTYNIYTQI